MAKIAVIGAGITGITTAYYLARSGHEVVVFDSNPFPAWGTSYSNGGQLSVSNSQVWNTWSTVLKGLKWVFDPAAPLRVNPKPSWPKIKWIAGFLLTTALGHATKNTLATIDMALRARQLYHDIEQEENIKFDHGEYGIMHVYRDADIYNKAKQTAELYRFAGCGQHVVELHAAKKIEPAIASWQNIIGTLYTPDDSTGDARMFCENLSSILLKKYGVKFHYSSTVTNIRNINNKRVALSVNDHGVTTVEHFDHTVICAGPAAASVAKLIGESINVYPVKGYSITIELLDEKSQRAAPFVSILDEQKKIVCSRLGNRFRVAGTAELDDWNTEIRQERIEPLIGWVKENFPNIDTTNYRAWAGLRPMTPNMLPIVRQSKKLNRVWYNTGHGHLGWTLGAATAEEISRLIS